MIYFLIAAIVIIVAAVLWLVWSFLVFLWAKANQPAFGVELAENATYIRKPSGQLVKIADRRYDKSDLVRFRALAMQAQKEVSDERNIKN